MQFLPFFAISFTIALPTIAPSEQEAISYACSGVAIPKPIAHGISDTFFTCSTISLIFVVILLLTPVTPSEDTQYKNPFASPAIIRILSFEVGAIIDISSIPAFSNTSLTSSFSSKGTSGMIIPSIPHSAHLLVKRSTPYVYTGLIYVINTSGISTFSLTRFTISNSLSVEVPALSARSSAA